MASSRQWRKHAGFDEADPPPTVAAIESVSALAELGLSETEIAAYAALVRHRSLALTELSRVANMSTRHLAACLSGLEQKGLVTRSADRPPRFVASPPDMAVEALILERQEAMHRARLAAHRLLETMQAMPPHQPAELVELLTGETAIVQRLTQLQRSARREVLMFDRPPHVRPSALPLPRVELESLARGVRWRAIYDERSLERPGEVEALRQLAAAGEVGRVVAGLPMKLAIADDQLALIPLKLDEPGLQSAVLVHSSALLAALSTLFELLWQRAGPLRLRGSVLPDTDPAGLDASARDVAALLAAGMTDRMIARTLSIAPRTLDRRIKEVMAFLGARTRFQAGSMASGSGLLAHHPVAPSGGGEDVAGGDRPSVLEF